MANVLHSNENPWKLEQSHFLQTSFHQAYEPEHVKDAVKHQTKNLAADYSRIDVPSYVEAIPYLEDNEKEMFVETLSEFPTLFGGKLGH
jgi:tagatose-1,6-bisphosphate aldolase